MLKKLLLIFIPAVALVLQVGFVPALPAPFNTFSIVLVYCVLLAFVYSMPHALYHTLIFGWVIGLYTPYPFGTTLVALAAALVVAGLLLRTVLTNKSIYALLLVMLVATLAFAFTQTLIVWIGFEATGNVLLLQANGGAYAVGLAAAAGGNVLLAAIGFYVIHYFTDLLQ